MRPRTLRLVKNCNVFHFAVNARLVPLRESVRLETFLVGLPVIFAAT